MGFKGKGVKVKGVKVKGVKVKGETVLFEFTKKYQKVPGTFAMVPTNRDTNVLYRMTRKTILSEMVETKGGTGQTHICTRPMSPRTRDVALSYAHTTVFCDMCGRLTERAI